MAVITREDVVAIAPELDAIPASDARWAIYLDDAAMDCPEAFWGERHARAQRLLVAHWMTLSRQAASGSRTVVSETVGGVSRSYAAPAAGTSSKSWEATAYGQELARLGRTLAAGPRAALSSTARWPL